MVDLRKIPIMYRAAYLKRESEYVKEVEEWFHMLDDNDPLKEIARQQVLKKRKKFYDMWLTEYNKQYVNDNIFIAFIKRIFKK